MTITRHFSGHSLYFAIPFPTTRTSASPAVMGVGCRQGKRVIGEWRDREQGQDNTQNPIARVALGGMPG